MNKKIRTWEIFGAILTILVGSALHFLFAWSGNWKPIALIAAVNESTWEHLKLAFWPAFFFMIFEYAVFAKATKNFFFAQAIKFIVMPATIVVLFYGWKLFFEDSLIYDISIFVVAVIFGYITSYKILISKRDYNLEKLGAALALIILIKFSIFTYFPPQYVFFKDPVHGGYGIEK